MSIQISVDELYDTSVMYWKFSPDWTWKDMDEARNVARAYFDSALAKMPLIFDMSDSDYMPDGAIRKFPEIMQSAHQNAGDVILVAGSQSYITSLVKQVSKLVEGIYHTRWNFHFVDSLADAEQMVKQMQEEAA